MKSNRFLILFVALCALLLMAVSAFAEDADPIAQEKAAQEDISGPFDMERCVKRGLAYNPRLAGIRAQLMGAEFGRRASIGQMLPAVGGTYGYSYYDRKYVYSNDHDDWTASLNLTQPIFRGFGLLANWQRAALTKESTEAQVRNVELALVSSIQSNFLSLLKARKDVKSAEDSVARLESQLKVISAFYDVGLRPKAEVLDAEVDLASAKQDLLNAQNAVSTQNTKLNAQLNIELETPVDYVGELKQFPFQPLTLQQGLARAYESRPDLIIGQKSVAIAEKESTIAASSMYPQVDAQWDYINHGVDAGLNKGSTYPYENKEYWTVGVKASMSIFEWGSDYYGVKQADQVVKQVQAELEETRLNAGFEVKTSLLNLTAAADRIVVAQKSVDAAEEAYRMAVARYQAQVGTNTDVLNAQSRLTDSEAQLSLALADYGTAISELYVAMGEKNLGLEQNSEVPQQ